MEATENSYVITSLNTANSNIIVLLFSFPSSYPDPSAIIEAEDSYLSTCCAPPLLIVSMILQWLLKKTQMFSVSDKSASKSYFLVKEVAVGTRGICFTQYGLNLINFVATC